VLHLPTWIVAVVLVCGVPPACAGDVFEGLGPELIGSELTVVLEGAELACRQDTADSSLRRCQPLPGALETLGGARITSAEALFVNDRLAMVSIYFSDREFAKVRAYAVQKLGDGQDWTVTLRGGMNLGFKDQIVIWEKEDLHALLQQFDRKIDRSSLIYGSPRAMAETLKRIKATPAGGVRDL
jgi:hypothetical protein